MMAATESTSGIFCGCCRRRYRRYRVWPDLVSSIPHVSSLGAATFSLVNPEVRCRQSSRMLTLLLPEYMSEGLACVTIFCQVQFPLNLTTGGWEHALGSSPDLNEPRSSFTLTQTCPSACLCLAPPVGQLKRSRGGHRRRRQLELPGGRGV